MLGGGGAPPPGGGFPIGPMVYSYVTRPSLDAAIAQVLHNNELDAQDLALQVLEDLQLAVALDLDKGDCGSGYSDCAMPESHSGRRPSLVSGLRGEEVKKLSTAAKRDGHDGYTCKTCDAVGLDVFVKAKTGNTAGLHAHIS
eukprot:gene399-1763_t